jgi:SPP1 gp7 family putative phage head morphogenesis protein
MADRDENQFMRDAAIRHQIGLLRVAAGWVNDANENLDSSEPELKQLIERFLNILTDERVDLSSPTIQIRLRRMREAIADLREKQMREVEEEAEERSRLLILAQFGWLGLTVRTITNGRLRPESPGGAALARAMVKDLPFEGRTLRTWLRDLAALDAKRIADEIVTGLVQGRSARDILKSVFGTGRMNGTDGVTQRTRNDLSAVLSTAVTHFSAQATDKMAEVNAEMFPRDVFTAVLDGRTTPICRSLDGNVYRRGKGPIPPLHMHCRSIRVALLAGQVPRSQNYSQWLKTQPAEVQDDILGKARGALFRNGGLTLDRFVDQNGRLFTLEELAAYNRDAFRAAGLDPDSFGV